MRTRYVLFSLVVVLLVASCASVPDVDEPEPQPEPPVAPAPAPAPEPAPEEPTPEPAPVPIVTQWEAVDMQVSLGGGSYPLPEVFRNSRFIGSFGEQDLTIEAPELAFTMFATYEPVGNGMYRVTPVRYENVPAGIQELAALAEQEIGGPLPDDYYVEVSRRGGFTIIEAEALGFALRSTWTLLE